ncbi:DMT family transporter [Burkholderia gladioli]|uniref:DMT family transporter n=1 Tax=Burkholderia gladioli TaxID=28095 RepID=UPI000CFE3D37|nr:DMT family transporter [Burkholderia gladioli]MBU9276863.1 DMT family transporter [Burkholderia gladioli]MDN7742263.1 DMT family transporter [Burkholderia gladioli]PRG56358.1 EamA family transporter [Burkholderia gladioli]
MNPAYFAFGALGLIWGTNFMFMKWASADLAASQIVFLRVLFGFIPLLAVALFSKALKWRHLRHAHHFVVMSLLATVIYYYAFAKGAGLLFSSIAGMLSGAIPLFSFLCAWSLLREERPNVRMIAGIVSGFLGVLLIARPWNAHADGVNLLGVGYMVAGSLSVGCSFVYARRFLSGLDLSPLALSTWQIGFALVLIGCVTDFHGMARVTAHTRALAGLVLGLGLTGTGIAYILYYFIVRRLGAVAASSVTYIPPVVALIMGSWIAHEPIGMVELLAMGAILGGVFLLQSGRQPHASAVRGAAKAAG